MAACVFWDFFDFLALVGFFVLSAEAMAALPFPPLPATAGVSDQFFFAVAATSAAKSLSGRSIPSPKA